jgi:putative transposase
MPTIGYRGFIEAKGAITRYIIGYYNSVRPHQYNQGMTPNDAEKIFWSSPDPMASFC